MGGLYGVDVGNVNEDVDMELEEREDYEEENLKGPAGMEKDDPAKDEEVPVTS